MGQLVSIRRPLGRPIPTSLRAPCPVLSHLEVGQSKPRSAGAIAAPGAADLRTDLPKYWVWRDGAVVEERAEVTSLWASGERMVAFLLGSSASWEHLLHETYLPARHVEEGRNVGVYRTALLNTTVGPFGGRLAVTMRPYLPSQLAAVAGLTSRYPGAHGAPLHWGDASDLGVSIDSVPDWGEQVTIRDGEVPVFWASGTSALDAISEAELPFAITSAPGHLLVSDLTDSELHVPNLEDPSQAVETRACRACTSRRARVNYETPWQPPRRSRRGGGSSRV